jgi:hypothetical protein
MVSHVDSYHGMEGTKLHILHHQTQDELGTTYLSLGVMSDAKHKKMNTVLFEGYLHDLHEAISNLWIITPQVVAHYWDITNIKAT